jgi:hypothetical protein
MGALAIQFTQANNKNKNYFGRKKVDGMRVLPDCTLALPAAEEGRKDCSSEG